MAKRARPAPKSLGDAGKQHWRVLTKSFEFEDWELSILASLCETLDRLDEVRTELASADLVQEGRAGSRAHPLLAVERDLRATLLRHYRALKLGDVEEEAAHDSHARRRAALLGHDRARRGA